MLKPDRELELKLGMTKKELELLATSPRLASQAGCTAKHLTSVYYDTPDHRLYAGGLILRVRNTGSSFVQTVKLGTYTGDGLSDRVEVEDRLESGEPDVSRIHASNIRRKVMKAIGGRALAPLFETGIDRTTYRLRTRSSVMELALDRGETRALTGSSEICEAELELIRGTPEDLLRMAQTLFAGTAAYPCALTKAERGYRLLGMVRPAQTALAAYSQPSGLARGQSCGVAFGAILRQAREQIVANRAALLENGEPETVHQLRVGLTRLRSAHRALEALSNSRQLRQLETDARAISRAVGRLRDTDVMIEHICAPAAVAAGPGEAGFAALLEALRAHREAMLLEAKAALMAGRWTRLSLALAVWPAIVERNPALREPVEECVDKLLRKRWKKVAKSGRLIESLNGVEQHNMRKALKKLRYTAEFLAPLYPKNKAAVFIRRLKQLQDIFGYVNDVRMAAALTGIARRHSRATAPLVAAGIVLGYHEAEAEAAWLRAHRAWHRLKASGPFWK
jgi:inorganic triphosphatase YgiF